MEKWYDFPIQTTQNVQIKLPRRLILLDEDRPAPLIGFRKIVTRAFSRDTYVKAKTAKTSHSLSLAYPFLAVTASYLRW